MAKYRVTEPFYRLGVYSLPGEIVELPDNEFPSVTFEPLDSAAEKAIAALSEHNKARAAARHAAKKAMRANGGELVEVEEPELPKGYVAGPTQKPPPGFDIKPTANTMAEMVGKGRPSDRKVV